MYCTIVPVLEDLISIHAPVKGATRVLIKLGFVKRVFQSTHP